MAKRPGGAMRQGPLPTKSQLVPVITKWPELTSKSQLVPMIVTILFVLLMYTLARDNSPIPYFAQKGVFTSKFIVVIVLYLNLASLYFIYRLAGKRKSWLALVGAALFTLMFMTTPIFRFALVFFHDFLAGGLPTPEQSFPVRLYKMSVAAGLFEELTKSLPIFLLWWFNQRMTPRQRELYGIEEPLDGILIGVGSAAGFAIYETVGQYVSNVITDRWVAYAAALAKAHLIPAMSPDSAITLMSDVIGCAPGVQLAIPRSLDQAFGHMAYSGYFGYFIGLAVMKPEKRWQILGIGLSSAALVHGMWNATPSDLTLVVALIAVASYAVLAAAILKAREISPKKAVLQPSIIFGSSALAADGSAAGVAGPPWGSAREMQPGFHPSDGASRPSGPLTLRVGERSIAVVAGLKLMSHQLPGLMSRGGDAVVAAVRGNPKDPAILGLQNLSTSPWKAIVAGGQRQVEPGRTVRLKTGVRIDFGGVRGEVL